MTRGAALALGALACACAPEPRPAPVKVASSHAPFADPAAPAEEPSSAAFGRLVEARAGEVRRCYEAARGAGPEPHGLLVVRLTVLPTGAVEGARVESTTLEREEIGACVAAVLGGWRTPFRPSRPVGLDVPLGLDAPR